MNRACKTGALRSCRGKLRAPLQGVSQLPPGWRRYVDGETPLQPANHPLAPSLARRGARGPYIVRDRTENVA